MSSTPTLEQVVAHAKRRGFVFPTSEIYGGLANSYDYGPLGAQLLKNIKDLWWRRFVEQQADMVGLQTQILQHPQTWVASGHVGAFNDPLVEDTVTNKRYRADHLVEEWLQHQTNPAFKDLVVEDLSLKELGEFIAEHDIPSPDGNPVSAPKAFNLLFESSIGSVSDEKSKVYLRGETAQGIFTNFKQVLDSTRVKLPFGIGNFGTSFRNEITTGQFVFRTLEFEQAEIEYFFNPAHQDWQKLLEEWKASMWRFVEQDLGVQPTNLRWRQHTDKERSHYSKDTYDLDYNFPFGFKELWGVAYRTDYDLRQHMAHSGQSLEYTDPHTQQIIVPHVIEPALGLGRAFLMILTDTLVEESDRVVLKLKPSLAPYHAAVFPLVKNKPKIVQTAQELHAALQTKLRVAFDDRGNIGKRYLSQDEIGTPFCVTIDYDTLESGTVTVRDRNTTDQAQVSRDKLAAYLDQQIND